jgi:hypothetical protein
MIKRTIPLRVLLVDDEAYMRAFVGRVLQKSIECTVVERRVPRAGPAPSGGRWVSISALAGLAMTSPGRRIAALVADHGAASSRSGSPRGGRRLIQGKRSANLVKPSPVE